MGNPQHFGIELPQRCLTLLDRLWDLASETYSERTPHLGPLTSTFLISMSMPIINIPTERIEKYLRLRDTEGYVDDRHINAEVTQAFQDVLQRRQLEDAPFFEVGTWSFYEYVGEPMNLTRDLPENIASELDKDEAMQRAAQMPSTQWLGVLRNALAHGGILYLNEHGRSAHDVPVKMFGFVNGRFGKGLCPHDNEKSCRAERVPNGLNILRIGEREYYEFLRKWVDWMREAGIAAEAA